MASTMSSPQPSTLDLAVAGQPEWVLSPRQFQGEVPSLPEGRTVDRSKLPILAAGFVQALREAGVEVPIGATLLYIRALSAVNSVDRSERYWCGRTTLITRSEDFLTYHKVFGRYWVGAEFDDAEQVTTTTTVAVDQEDEDGSDDSEADGDDSQPDVTMRYSAVEVLHDKDFAEYTKEELAELHHLVSQIRIGGAVRPTRRQVRSQLRRGTPDLRRTVRRALANDGEPIDRAFRKKSENPRRVVLLLDISGSMEAYSRPCCDSSMRPCWLGVASKRLRSAPA